MVNSKFDCQPSWCREKIVLPPDRLESLTPMMKRIVLFDPSSVYERLSSLSSLNVYKRFNSIPMDVLFIQEPGVCSCGCGSQLTGRRKRWATKTCSRFAGNIQLILSGHSHLRSLCQAIYTSDCVACGIPEMKSEHAHELDHKHPVKFGGACGWLGNYEFKCRTCHRKKTNEDFGFKQK